VRNKLLVQATHGKRRTVINCLNDNEDIEGSKLSEFTENIVNNLHTLKTLSSHRASTDADDHTQQEDIVNSFSKLLEI
jgi:hypothetical protein